MNKGKVQMLTVTQRVPDKDVHDITFTRVSHARGSRGWQLCKGLQISPSRWYQDCIQLLTENTRGGNKGCIVIPREDIPALIKILKDLENTK
jgi:hypothetical protein